MEYPPIKDASIPLSVLQKADANLFLYLNNADRDVVESFTGELPPKMPIHSFFSRLAQLGLTSQKAAVK